MKKNLFTLTLLVAVLIPITTGATSLSQKVYNWGHPLTSLFATAGQIQGQIGIDARNGNTQGMIRDAKKLVALGAAFRQHANGPVPSLNAMIKLIGNYISIAGDSMYISELTQDVGQLQVSVNSLKKANSQSAAFLSAYEKALGH
jgi:hypothetical protein